jgi:hypothetical protein
MIDPTKRHARRDEDARTPPGTESGSKPWTRAIAYIWRISDRDPETVGARSSQATRGSASRSICGQPTGCSGRCRARRSRSAGISRCRRSSPKHGASSRRCAWPVAQATTAIEGNSLTLAQVQAAVRGDLRVPPSQEYLEHEVDNVIDACRMIEDRVASTKAFELSVDLLKELRPPAAWTRRRRTRRPRRAWRSQHAGRH